MFGIDREQLWDVEVKLKTMMFNEKCELDKEIKELKKRVEVLENKIGAEFCPHCGKVVDFKEKK